MDLDRAGAGWDESPRSAAWASVREVSSSSVKRLAGLQGPWAGSAGFSGGPGQEAVLLPKAKTSFLSQLVVFS